MTVKSSQNANGSGTGTFFSAGVVVLTLCQWMASRIVYSRSIWWAAFDTSFPAGFLRKTQRLPLFSMVKTKLYEDLWDPDFASMRRYHDRLELFSQAKTEVNDYLKLLHGHRGLDLGDMVCDVQVQAIYINDGPDFAKLSAYLAAAGTGAGC